MLEVLTGTLLAGVVGASLVLGGLIWSGAMWASSPLAHGSTLSRAYYVEGDVTNGGDATGVAVPERIVLLYPQGRDDEALGDPSAPAFSRTWTAVLALLGKVTAGKQLASMQPIGFKQVAKTLAAFSSPHAPAGPAACTQAGVEVDIGPVVPWNAWLQAASGIASTGEASVSVDRIVLLPTAGGSTSGPSLYLFDGAAAESLNLAVGDDNAIEQLVCSLQGQYGPNAYAVAPLSAQLVPDHNPGVHQTVPDAGALLVPGSTDLPSWRPRNLRQESLDANANSLALSIFPDPLAVHSSRGPTGIVFTSAEDWQLTVSGGRATLFTPPAAGTPPDWGVGLLDALRFVDVRGAWPQTAWLSGVEGSDTCTFAGCSAPTAYTYLFATRLNQLPVLSPADAAPAVSVTIAGGGQVTFYARAVPLDGGETSASPVFSAAAAVEAIYRDPPAALAGRDFEVVSAVPAWVPLWNQQILEPAWAVEVDQAQGGEPETFLVDAENENVIGLWRGTSAGGGS